MNTWHFYHLISFGIGILGFDPKNESIYYTNLFQDTQFLY